MQPNSIFLAVIAFVIGLSSANQSFAAGRKKGGKGAFAGGSISAGFGVGVTTADQAGLNTMIGVSKNTANASTSNFGSGLEFMGHLTFKFANNFTAIQIRPTYLQQSTSGTGADGSHSYDLVGYTLFPLVRIIPLSNDIIDFYMQAGVGYGKLEGSITNGPTKATFTGSSFGLQAGLGADFCLLPDHCFGIEGNYRYLPIDRNIVGSSNGTVTGASQSQAGRELEDLNGSDVATTLTGISGILTYTFNF